jgi:hypothetical protein
VSEKNNNIENKYTLAACLDIVKADEEFDELPPHITVAPPFLLTEKKFNNLIRTYYNLISSWSSFVYDEGESTEVLVEKDVAIFGTEESPIAVRRISLGNDKPIEDLLALREFIKEGTENICGKKSTKEWVIGDFHISETVNNGLIIPENLSINSLTLFVKRNKKWKAVEEFFWNE